MNEKLDVNITGNKINMFHRIGRKKDAQRRRSIIVKFTRCNTRKNVFASKREVKEQVLA